MNPYGYTWRHVIRPRILKRDCYQCVRCSLPDRPRGLRSNLEIAHLSGQSTDDTDLATLCARCHKAEDYPSWSKAYREWLVREKERKLDEADRQRPILQLLEGVCTDPKGSSVQTTSSADAQMTRTERT